MSNGRIFSNGVRSLNSSRCAASKNGSQVYKTHMQIIVRVNEDVSCLHLAFLNLVLILKLVEDQIYVVFLFLLGH